MSAIRIPVTAHAAIDTATEAIPNRSLLYDKDKNRLYVKYNSELQALGNNVDNDNIVLNEDGEISLADDVHCKSLIVTPDDSGVSFYENKVLDTTSSDRTIIPIIKKIDSSDTSNIGVISGEIYEMGDALSSSYHFSVSSTGSRSLQGASSYSEKASFIQLEYNDEIYYGLQFPSGIAATIYFHGFDCRNGDSMPSSDILALTDSDWKTSDEITSDATQGSEIVTYSVSESSTYSWDFTSVPDSFDNSSAISEDASESWSSSGSENADIDFGNGLVLNTSNGVGTYIATDATLSGTSPFTDNTETNTGCIRVSDTGDSHTFKLTLTSACTVTVYFSSNSGACSIASEDGSVLATTTASSSDSFSVVQYDDTDYSEHSLYIDHTGQLAIWYIDIRPNTSAIVSAIESMVETGEDGSPNKLTISGVTFTTKDEITAIADVLKNSSKMVYLDLSGCTCTDDAAEWDEAIFENCTSLYALKMPDGVTTLSGNIFSSCTYLHKLQLSDSITSIESDTSYASTTGVFAGTQITSIVLPKNLAVPFGNYILRGSNITSVYFHREWPYYDTSKVWFSFATWYGANSACKFYMYGDIYDSFMSAYNNGTYWTTTWGYGFNFGSAVSEATDEDYESLEF